MSSYQMKLFLDTARIEHIKTAMEWNVLDGVTTNPTLLSKNTQGTQELIEKISFEIGHNRPISVEVLSETVDGMYREAVQIAKWAPSVVIKIPITPNGLQVIKRLNNIGIKTNATLIFSIPQAILAAKSGASYVSPFIGRLDDIGCEGIPMIRDLVQIFKTYNFKTEIIVASIRHPQHVIESAKVGAHIVTVPFNVLEKMMYHPLTDIGIETFKRDWENSK